MNSIGMFIIGSIIFCAYVGFLVWNIYYGARKNREENYPDYYSRHNQADFIDYDGHGNYGRFPNTDNNKKKKKKTKQQRVQSNEGYDEQFGSFRKNRKEEVN